MGIAPDGSPVELYLALPELGEAALVHRAIPAGAAILELGCGVGRVTAELVRRGHEVVAVDESQEMLEHVECAETVRSRIEDLDLGRRFPCVLMMSQLVNTEEPQRLAFLAAAARHLAADGIVLIERYAPGWSPEEAEPAQRGNVLVSLEDVELNSSSFSAVARYDLGRKTWRQPFTAWILDDAELEESLARAGLALAEVLDDSRRWVSARSILSS